MLYADLLGAFEGLMEIETHFTDEESARYQGFYLNLLGKSLPEYPPATLWHYTSAEALIAILRTSTLWTTHVACLNDPSEFRYSLALVRKCISEVKSREDTDPRVAEMLTLAELGVADHVTETQGWFTASFSITRDDLNQWRSYGGGEGGYAIGFKPALLKAAVGRAGGFLWPVCYDLALQTQLAEQIVCGMGHFYLEGLRRRSQETWQSWTVAFMDTWAALAAPFACFLKDPCYSSEQEWRMIMPLRDGGHKDLIFQRRATMLSRHLPVVLGHRLPLAEIVVGPNRSQRSSKISVGDLLKHSGYGNDVSVGLSSVPLRSMG